MTYCYTTWQSFNQFLYKLEVNNIITFEEITEEYIKNREKINKEVFKNKTNVRLMTKKIIDKKNDKLIFFGVFTIDTALLFSPFLKSISIFLKR